MGGGVLDGWFTPTELERLLGVGVFTDGLGGIIGQGLIGGLLGTGGARLGFSLGKAGATGVNGALSASGGLLIIASGILVSGLKIGGSEDWFWLSVGLLETEGSTFGSSPVHVGLMDGFTS